MPLSLQPVSGDEFAGLIAPLGPWAGASRIAVAVSGGADSLCLALLAARWAAARGIATCGLIVDHALRPAAAAEAETTRARLSAHAIDAVILRLRGLDHGPALAARARAARYAALTEACRQRGLVDLLLGHHAGDQAETVLMRSRAGSGPDGLAGMAAIAETNDLRLLRPLLGIDPARLRHTLQAMGLDWVEDPSNRDVRALRTRLRSELADNPALAADLRAEARAAGNRRADHDAAQAALLAGSAMLRPEGFALLPRGLLPPRALAALLRTIAGAAHAPPAASVEALTRRPRLATLGGARLLPAGRLGAGWLVVREASQVQGPIMAAPGVFWDRRFRLCAQAVPKGATIAARRHPGLPARVGAVMPALLDAAGDVCAGARFELVPPSPATAAPSFPEQARLSGAARVNDNYLEIK
ncbi:tRNA lysidine(34) synthetase TilS [Lichenicoccus sp.]|uniref:tRNA lysidine(34) synthetase TilS n=1 Tax=Lichenicoccus sp. TaxID=2781899 RepID=UPI003D148194